MQHYGEQWLSELLIAYPQRRFVPFVIDANGRSVFVSRFLRSIRPPPEIETISADKKAAAVSLSWSKFSFEKTSFLNIFRILRVELFP